MQLAAQFQQRRRLSLLNHTVTQLQIRRALIAQTCGVFQAVGADQVQPPSHKTPQQWCTTVAFTLTHKHLTGTKSSTGVT